MTDIPEFGARLRDGTNLAVDSVGLEAAWFVGDNDFRSMRVEWKGIRAVRPLRFGNPFQPLKRRFEKYETGLFFVAESGMTFALEADEKGYNDAVSVIRAALGSRWDVLYNEEEVAVVHDGMDLKAPDTLRRPFEIINDPRRVRPGPVVAEEPPEVSRDRARPILRRALLALAAGWLLTASGAIVFAFSALSSGEFKLLVGGPILALGLTFVAISVINALRWRGFQPIVIHENGVYAPAQFLGAREQFIPFAYIRRIGSEYRRGPGQVMVLQSLPWVRAVEIPSSFPGIKELIGSRTKVIQP